MRYARPTTDLISLILGLLVLLSTYSSLALGSLTVTKVKVPTATIKL